MGDLKREFSHFLGVVAKLHSRFSWERTDFTAKFCRFCSFKGLF
jgi:hypothetical protein